ncbi:MAG: hypothetical protein Q9157_001797 [Trypethelium eluteriae]
MPKRRLNLGEYTVGWICALPIELAAATEMLDEEHKSPPPDQSDPNLYTLGRIGDHNVVLVCLSAGQIGGSSAAAVAARLKSKFKSFQFGLMVGVGGGVPSDKVDIRLGDVVISHPTGEFGGVVQYDLGKVEKTGQLIRTGSLNAPPQVLLQAVSKLRSNHDRRRSTVSHHLARFSHVETGKFDRDQAGLDRLFESSYDHNQGATCDDCSIKRLVKWKPRMANETVIHYGTIASGNRVMKDGTTRDKLSTDLKDVLCYEMEAAGLMNFFPCLVIRGICDYSDSHKNKGWQPFAAATAAACAREILSLIPGTGTLLEADREDSQILQNWSSKNPEVEKMRILKHKDPLIEGSCNWVFDDPSFISWWKNDGDEYRILWIHGDPGKGKTMMMMAIIDELSERIQQTSDRRTISYFFCQSTVPELSSTEGIIRGLTYSLAHSNRQLIKILQTKLKNGIDRENLLVELWDTLSAMIKDPSIDRVYLLVDALDECRHSPLEKNKGEEDLLEIFLNLLTRIDLSPWRKVKWILTSRNEPKISESLRNLCQDTSLEVNSTNVSKAVDRFIDIKCEQLACRKNYSSELLQFVKKYLTDNAGGTFLWVALICKELGRRHGLVTSDIKALLRTFPRDLVPLYDRMLELVRESQNAERIYDLAFMHPAISGLLEGQVPLDEKPSWLKTTSFLEIPTSKCLRPLSTKPYGEYPISKFVISISSDSKQIALAMGHDILLGCMERRSHHYFPRKPQDLKKLARRRSMVSDFAFSPDNKKLAVASGQIELYEIARGRFVTTSRHEEGADCHAVSFSPDGRFLTSYSTRLQVNSSTGDDPPSKAPSVVRVWDLNVNAISKEFGSSLYPMAGSTIAFSPDGTIVALSGKSTRQNVTINTVELCSIATGERIQQLNLSDQGGIERILSFRDRLFVFTGKGPIDVTDPGSVIFAPQSTSLPGLYLERNRLICGSEPIFMLPTGIGLLWLRERKPEYPPRAHPYTAHAYTQSYSPIIESIRDVLLPMLFVKGLLYLLPFVAAAPLDLEIYKRIDCSSSGIYPTPTYGIRDGVFTVCATINIKGTIVQASNAILNFRDYYKWNQFVYTASVPSGVQTPSGVKPGLPVLFNSTGVPPGTNTSSTDIMTYIEPPYLAAWKNVELEQFVGHSEHVQLFVSLGDELVQYVNYQTQYGANARNILYLVPDFQRQFELQANDLKAYVESRE